MPGRQKIIILSLLFLFVSCLSKEDKNNCARFKNGSFIYQIKSIDSSILVNRNDSIQIETNVKKSFILRERIIWNSPCEYELIFLSRDPEYPPEFSEEKNAFFHKIRSIPLKTTIIATGPDYYVFESSKKGVDLLLRDTMWIAK